MISSFKIIKDSKEFFEKNFKKYVTALESLLKKEYQTWFDSISSTNNASKDNGILNQSFLKLIVFFKVAHIQLKITEDKQEMFVFLRSGPDKIKIVCLFAKDGEILESGSNHETTV